MCLTSFTLLLSSNLRFVAELKLHKIVAYSLHQYTPS